MSLSSASSANRILVLLVISVTINYLDRGALSVAAPAISRELSFSPSQMGLLFSVFFWSYSTLQLVGGWLVDRYPVRWVYAGGFFAWSLSTVSVAFLGSLPGLAAARLFLGAGESVAYPAFSKFLAQEFREDRRGMANAAIDAGSKIGPALSILLGGVVVARFGWRALFLSAGLISLLWLLPWLAWTRSGSAAAAPSGSRGPGWAEILTKREAWGTSLGMFSLGYGWYFLLSWLPTYLVRERGLSVESMAVLGSLPFWTMAASSLTAGWAADRWIRAGAEAGRIRLLFVTSGLLLCGMMMLPVALVRTPAMSIALVTGACLCLGLFSSNCWAVTQTLAGPDAAGKWTAIQNTIGNFGGVASPLLTGWIVDRTGSFVISFLVTSSILFAGAAVYLLMVRKVVPVTWSAARDESADSKTARHQRIFSRTSSGK
jgi:MFS family permease